MSHSQPYQEVIHLFPLYSTISLTQHFIFFFFSSRRRHTRYWRDWSSDVCSSDLEFEVLDALTDTMDAAPCANGQEPSLRMQDLGSCVQLSQSALSRVVGRLEQDGLVTRAMCADDRREIGRASCKERV